VRACGGPWLEHGRGIADRVACLKLQDSGDAEDKDEADNESESESDWEAELNLSDSDTAPSVRHNEPSHAHAHHSMPSLSGTPLIVVFTQTNVLYAYQGRKLGLDLDGMDAQGEMARKPTEESVRGTLPPRYKLNTDDDQHVEIQKYATTKPHTAHTPPHTSHCTHT